MRLALLLLACSAAALVSACSSRPTPEEISRLDDAECRKTASYGSNEYFQCRGLINDKREHERVQRAAELCARNSWWKCRP